MGFVGSLFDNDKGAGFSARSTPMIGLVRPDQLNQSAADSGNAYQQQQSFLDALNAQGGIGNQSNVFGQQQALANQLQQQSMGQGPNPAMAQLAMTTGQNIGNQAALMAGQRGASANPGLMARQIGMQGANTQQQANAQAALMAANQQLAAQQQLAGQQANMAGLATQQVGQQQAGTQALNQLAQAREQGYLSAANAENVNNANMQSNINNANASIAAKNASAQEGLFKGAMNALGSAAMMGAGGLGGGTTGASAGGFSGANLGVDTSMPSFQTPSFLMKSDGGQIPNKPGSGYMAYFDKNMKSGGMVPGKAKVAGDSPKNDTVPALVSPGEVVLPRSVVGSPDKTAEFVNHILGFNLRSGKKK